MSFNAQLIELLKSDVRFVDEDNELIDNSSTRFNVSNSDKALNKAFYGDVS